eukprot:1279595-Ditylum_brightwellii.AAC.1
MPSLSSNRSASSRDSNVKHQYLRHHGVLFSSYIMTFLVLSSGKFRHVSTTTVAAFSNTNTVTQSFVVHDQMKHKCSQMSEATQSRISSKTQLFSNPYDSEFNIDDDDYDDDDFFEDEDSMAFAQISQKQLSEDDYSGALGFDEVVDWEYYNRNEEDGSREVVNPPFMDPTKPKRTRESSGSV